MIIENLIGIKEIDISKFKINKITYKIKIFGDISDVIKGLSSNSFIEINDIFIDTNSLELTFNERLSILFLFQTYYLLLE